MTLDEVKDNKFRVGQTVYCVDDLKRRPMKIIGLEHAWWRPVDEDGNMCYFSQWSYEVARNVYFPEKSLHLCEFIDCPDCKGKGIESYTPNGKCGTCHGKAFIRQEAGE